MYMYRKSSRIIYHAVNRGYLQVVGLQADFHFLFSTFLYCMNYFCNTNNFKSNVLFKCYIKGKIHKIKQTVGLRIISKSFLSQCMKKEWGNGSVNHVLIHKTFLRNCPNILNLNNLVPYLLTFMTLDFHSYILLFKYY